MVFTETTDLVKVRVSAWTGTFGGIADVYLGTGRLGEVATQLRRLPMRVQIRVSYIS